MTRVANLELELLKTSKAEGATLPYVSVADGYDRWALTYDHDPNPLLAREERHLMPLLACLRGKRVLDLACGTGRWLEKLMASGPELAVGVDCSTAMLRVARNKPSITERLTQSACENLPLRNAGFDLAICSFAMGHIRDLESTVRELARVAKPGADVFVSDLHPEALSHGWSVGFRNSNAAAQIETSSRSAEDIVRTFCRSGFDCVTCDSLWLGEPERPVFVRAGRSRAFADACRVPAVLVCRFMRRGRRAAGKNATAPPTEDSN